MPKEKTWMKYIPVLDLVPLFRVKRQLGMVMNVRFTVLCVSAHGYYISERNTLMLIVIYQQGVV